MNLADRPCPLEEHGGILDPANGSTFRLLETLLQPFGADIWGNPATWLETPVGQHLVLQTIEPRERPWRIPVLLSAAGLWRAERRQALKRFSPHQKKPH